VALLDYRPGLSAFFLERTQGPRRLSMTLSCSRSRVGFQTVSTKPRWWRWRKVRLVGVLPRQNLDELVKIAHALQW